MRIAPLASKPATGLSVVMIAHREEDRIERALKSVRGWTDAIHVVVQTDDDPTEKVAMEHGAQVYRNPWTGYAAQKNFALSLANTPWILQLDADEVVSEEMRESILAFVNNDDPRYAAASFRGWDYFYNRFLKHGCGTRIWRNRLVRKNVATWQGGMVHEHQNIDGDSTLLDGRLHHYSCRSTQHLIDKNSHYADLFVAQRVVQKRLDVSRLSIVVRPLFRFFRSYVLRGGFLDGYAGYLYAWHLAHYTFMRYSRLREYVVSEHYRQKIDQMIHDRDGPGTTRTHGFDRVVRMLAN